MDEIKVLAQVVRGLVNVVAGMAWGNHDTMSKCDQLLAQLGDIGKDPPPVRERCPYMVDGDEVCGLRCGYVACDVCKPDNCGWKVAEDKRRQERRAWQPVQNQNAGVVRRVYPNGAVSIPDGLREALGIKEGDTMVLRVQDGGLFIKKYQEGQE